MVKNLRRMLSNFKLISLLILFCFCVKKQDDIIIYKPSFKGDFFNEEKIICNYTRFDEIKIIFDFIEATMNKVDTEVENALYVSFLEYLDFKGLNEKEIEGYLKTDLFNAWIQLRK